MSVKPEPAVHFSTNLVGADEIRLRGEGWVPGVPARAAVVIAHGKDEHIGRYRHVVEALIEQGYAVYSHDHRGHGKSDGRRGVIDRFDDYVDDLVLLVEFARNRNPETPVYLLGHSMGGLIAVRYALQHQEKLAGLILSGPALRVGDELPAWKRRAFLLLGKFAPEKLLAALEPDILSRDPAIGQAFIADPLCITGPTNLGFARTLYLAAEATRSRAPECALPLLIMHGEADKLTSPLGSKAFYEKAASPDKTLKLWPEDRHEIFNELDKAAVIAFMVNWLNARTTKEPIAV